MIEPVPLELEHLAAFPHIEPAAVPEDQFGKGMAFLDGGNPIAICMIWDNDGVAEVGLVMSAKVRMFPVSIHRLARQTLAGLHATGYDCIRTWPDSPRSAEWLRHLGFLELNGVFEKWLTP